LKLAWVGSKGRNCILVEYRLGLKRAQLTVSGPKICRPSVRLEIVNTIVNVGDCNASRPRKTQRTAVDTDSLHMLAENQVAAGLVDGLARPGGKRLQELVPKRRPGRYRWRKTSKVFVERRNYPGLPEEVKPVKGQTQATQGHA